MSDTLTLQCPSCTDNLEIDIGFAGGVCRCSSCGTLMTVPNDPRTEKVERVSRPDAPGSPSPANPSLSPQAQTGAPIQTTATGRPESPRPNAPSAQRPPGGTSRPAEPTVPTPVAKKPVLPPPQKGVEYFTTESGRVITVSTRKGIPTARKVKRAAIKAGVIAAFIVAMLLMVGGAVAVIVMMESGPSGTQNTKPSPFDIQAGNCFGVLLKDSVVIVLDTGSGSSGYLKAYKTALNKGLEHVYPGTRAQVVLCNGDGITRVPTSGLQDINEKNRLTMAETAENAKTKGEADLGKAISEAANAQPDQVIVVTNGAVDSATQDVIKSALDGHKWLRVDLVVIDPADPTPVPGSERSSVTFINSSDLRVWMR
ncbi:MAG: hypothetical protein GC164_09095 [Phycisphaera sp.]|nr:hypothetical protein [Phycisphaera sp.]